MPTVGLFNKEGNRIEDIQLNDKVFAVEVNADAMHHNGSRVELYSHQSQEITECQYQNQ